MLSAIAARKAAQAAQLAAKSVALQTTNKLDDEASDDNKEPDLEEKRASVVRRPETKRKPSIDTNDVRNKKGRKKQKTANPQTRYFATEAQDHIVIDVEEEGQDATSSTSEVDDETFPQHVHKSTYAQRAWSPSRPPLDSSDDDDEEFVEGTSGYDLEVPPSLPPLDNGYPSLQTLTFVPVSGQNVFHISEDESGPLKGRKGTILALGMGETLALQGVYSMTVLRGAVSVMGSDIQASSSSHHIFAPKCSPMPIIKAITYSSSSQIVPGQILQRISPECAAILLEDVVTGVEGLGRVCKLFEGVFGDNSSMDDAFRLSTAHMVSPCHSLLRSSTNERKVDSLPGPFVPSIHSTFVLGEGPFILRHTFPRSPHCSRQGRKANGEEHPGPDIAQSSTYPLSTCCVLGMRYRTD